MYEINAFCNYHQKVCSAIYNHSDKNTIGNSFDELLKDADVMQHGFYNITVLPMEHEVERFLKLKIEFELEEKTMLIRWATNEDKPAWMGIADAVAELFGSPTMSTDKSFHDYIDSKASKFEALVAVDRMSEKCLGFIGFSRANNRISWFAVEPDHRGKGVGRRLLSTAIKQMDNTKDMSVVTFSADCHGGLAARFVYERAGFVDVGTFFDENGNKRCTMKRSPTNEKRGGSFHYHYPEFIKAAQKENCPVCNNELAPDGQNDLEINDKVWIVAEYPGQGRLFGKMYVMPRKHFFHFEDMPLCDMADFMGEVQRVGATLRKVTGAEKINYEMHSNSGAHLHIHLFPRYLDDDFPSAPIDYRICEPAPYESYKEFLWFVERMKEELLI